MCLIKHVYSAVIAICFMLVLIHCVISVIYLTHKKSQGLLAHQVVERKALGA